MANKALSLALLRVALGLFFLIPGLGKLSDPTGITGMLSGLGFPAAGFFAWILLLSEIIFGASLIIGYKIKYAVWPLMVVLVVAIILVTIPAVDFSNTSTLMTLLWHLIGLTGLWVIRANGPGKLINI